MKKIVSLILLIFLATSFDFAYGAYKIMGGTKTKRIPRGTKLELKMAESITTADVEVGEMFTANLTKDIEIDNEVILPVGTPVRGNVVKIIPAKRFSRSAVLYINFDHIVTTSGRQLPIKAALCSYFVLTDDGAITNGGNYGYAIKKNWDKTVEITKKATLWGVEKGQELFAGGQILLTPFSAAGGVIGGGGYFLVDSIADIFKKGNEIVINQGKLFNILLINNLDVPVW